MLMKMIKSVFCAIVIYKNRQERNYYDLYDFYLLVILSKITSII